MSQFHWQPQQLGTSLSAIVQGDDAQDTAVRSLERGPNAPPNPTPGMLWHCTTAATAVSAGAPSGTTEAILRRTASGTWAFFARVDSASGGHGLLSRNGGVALTGNLPAGGNTITGLRAGAAAGEAVRFEQALVLTTSGTICFDAGARTVRSGIAPTHPNDLVRLVDVNPAQFPASCYWNTNRNALGGGNVYGAVKVQQQGVASDYTKMPYTPRRLTVRMFGALRVQGAGPLYIGGDAFGGRVFTLHRWNSDGTGGEPGTAVGAAVEVAAVANTTPVWLVAEWKYPGSPPGNNDAGCWLRLVQAANEADALTANGNWYDVVSPSNTNLAGTVQVLAEYGLGT